MSVEDADTIDFVGIERGTGTVVLTISDHLDWSNDDVHVAILQTKINTYLSFIESGEIYDSYPDSRGRAVRIDLVLRDSPSIAGAQFLEQVQEIVRGAGFELAVCRVASSER